MRRFAAAAACALSAIAAAAPAAHAHQGNPNFTSTIRAVRPAVPGLSLDVLDRDDRLALVNRTGKPVVIQGYAGEPYARVLADGTVEVNQLSPATYSNEDRFGATNVPDFVDAKAAPRWKVLDKTGRFEWHDHRIHYMATGRPPQVKDPKVRTKVFDWTVPMRVGSQPVRIAGTLTWVPREGGGPPAGAIGGLIALVLLGGAAVATARRRRAAADDDEDTGGAQAREAW